jgi:hypothetical protein
LKHKNEKGPRKKAKENNENINKSNTKKIPKHKNVSSCFQELLNEKKASAEV